MCYKYLPVYRICPCVCSILLLPAYPSNLTFQLKCFIWRTWQKHDRAKLLNHVATWTRHCICTSISIVSSGHAGITFILSYIHVFPSDKLIFDLWTQASGKAFYVDYLVRVTFWWCLCRQTPWSLQYLNVASSFKPTFQKDRFRSHDLVPLRIGNSVACANELRSCALSCFLEPLAQICAFLPHPALNI